MKNVFRILLLYLAVFIVTCFCTSCDDPKVDIRFQKRTYISSAGKILPYGFFNPNKTDTLANYPMVVFLHGGTGSGTNNINQVSGKNWQGSHTWIQTETQNKNPTFVIAPQIPKFYRWNNFLSDSLSTFSRLTTELIDTLIKSYTIDIDRIYLTGQSLGGWGVWDLIGKKPELFAAAIPVCGGGNPETAIYAKNVSIWAFHGKLDQVVSVKRSREMVAAFKAIGANIKYTEYLLGGHSIWDNVYTDENLIDWLFNQSKKAKL